MVSKKAHVLPTSGVQEILIKKSKFHPEEKQQLLEGNWGMESKVTIKLQ